MILSAPLRLCGNNSPTTSINLNPMTLLAPAPPC